MIDYPPSVELAQLPTPMQSLERIGDELGVELLCKRDDLTGSALSGNKVRKLEYLLADAIDQGAEGVITCGGEQSNHARATALSAARLGLKCHLLLRTADPKAPPPPSANILLERMAGASVQWISPDDYSARRDELMAQAGSAMSEKHYLIPEGGSDAVGAWGYVRCAKELQSDIGPRPATIICAVGSGGTVAGLIAGCRMLDLPYRIIGVSVADDRHTFQNRIAKILQSMAERYAIDVAVEAEGIEIWDDYVGLGYAISRDEELQSMISLARTQALITDPVYTGKAWHALSTKLKSGRRLGDPLVFLHTGGIFGLFPKGEQLAALL